MEFLLIPLVSLGASLLTFFSGFGLGTLLTPVFAIFFPIDLAIGLTAIVHFANNLFKLVLVGKFARKDVLLRFGIPAVLAALLGAWLLSQITHVTPWLSYQYLGKTFHILPVKVLLALLIVSFTLFEMIPKLRDMQIDRKFLSFGGLLSGFFGGLSGHQGALRSAFLARTNLSKEEFIATGVVIACMIDASRLLIYSKRFAAEGLIKNIPLLAVSTLAAFLGVYLGTKALKKITMKSIQNTVSICLFLLALALGLGII